jgi:hypothetical protein
MRSSLASLAPLLVTLFAVAGCGGNVSGAGARDAGPGPGDDSAVAPPGDAGPVNPNCPVPTRVGEGAACGTSGLVCPESATASDCQGNLKTLSCFCDGQSWTCEQAPPSNCELETCPSPSEVFPDGNCAAVAGLAETCASNNIPYSECGFQESSCCQAGMCTCTTSGWSCVSAQGPCATSGPPASCPEPSAISGYGDCSTVGMTCPANPKDCEGQTYFDTYQCQASGFGDLVPGYWISIATTTCALSLDAGPAYHSYDGGAGQIVDSVKRDTN